ncbi:transporter [Pseudoduganella namucuonensis]|uniref:Uncharacterized conserved protein n=1 Tax=Pseudoduganella namucuonensis TaxID=1035707 RepID=A0A1I7L700_9BURK|nr:transporter [Pseudoduganella namucuonensis]SFV05517.1 Uncharacterized conserved protein [Pseudoduganella namucuonensis]
MQHATRPASLPRLLAALTLAGLAPLGGAAEIATDPGDYAALPPGLQLGILYYQHAERDAYHAAGSRLPGPFSLSTDIGLARFVHYARLGDYVIDPQFIIPFGKVALKTPFGPLKPVNATGVGDPLVGGTLWVVNRPEQKQWLGLTAFVSLPVGAYDGARGPVNVGENRWKGIFQAGYVTALGKDVMLDLLAETAVYGDNDDFLGLRKEQRASYGVQTHLRYMLSAASSVALSYYHDFGGATSLNGADQRDRMNNGRWQLGFATFVTPSLQLMAQAGKAGKTENGARESSRLNLRVVKVY